MEKTELKKSLQEIAGKSFYRKFILNLLNRFQKGEVELTFPEGETLKFGQGNGEKAQIQIKNEDFFKKCFYSGDIGFGESYTDGDWESYDLTQVIKWVIDNVENSGVLSGSQTQAQLFNFLEKFNRLQHLFKRNSKKQSRQNISYHYDLSNDFYSHFLDPSMTYSCAHFKNSSESLEQAQMNKYEKICKSLDLKPGLQILEIGCGWGSFAAYAAQNYGVKVTGITLSKEQLRYARKKIKDEGLEKNIEFILKDYRDMQGKFDRVVSIEMIEAVGDEYLETFFKKCSELLKKEGLLTLQAITSPDSRYESFKKGVDWIQKHIFPGSLLPSIQAMNSAANKTSDLQLFSLEDRGLHYAKTLRLWRERFHQNFPKIKPLGFDEEFKRKWHYYLSYCEAAFFKRNISDVQLTFIRPNNRTVHNNYNF